LHVARCTLHVARCTLHVARCTLHVARCTLHVARCMLHPCSPPRWLRSTRRRAARRARPGWSSQRSRKSTVWPSRSTVQAARCGPLPRLHQDWAHPCHICTKTGLTPPTSAPGLGSRLPRLHQDWAHPSHICTKTGLTPATSAPELGSRLHGAQLAAKQRTTCSAPRG
jgi:hypothetical protein